MASPFRYFHKHKKAFLAVAAVLAIFIFVVGDAITRGGSDGNGGQATQTVATWSGGKLNAAQLNSLVAQRMLTDEFLQRLFVQGGARSEYDFPASIPPLFLNRQQADQIESTVIGAEVMASLAEQAGMTVSDSMINHYIEEMGLKKVSKDQIVGILDNLGQGNPRANEAIIFNTLRKMLLAYFYRSAYADASVVVMPEQRWDDWEKVKERISIEAAVLPVEKFIAEVPQPTEAQLQAFYNDFKEADPNQFFTAGYRELPSPDPGFAEPRRIRMQYLLGSVAQRAEKLLDTVTEDEIKDYYERNKRAEFQKMDLLGDDAFGAPAAETSSAPSTDGSVTPAEQPKADAEGAATEASPTEPETPAAESGTTPDKPAEQPAETPSTPPPAVETPPTEPASPAATEGETSSSVGRASPFRLVAFQQPPVESSEDSQPAEQPAAEPKASDEPAAASSDASSAAEPATETPEQPAPAATTPATGAAIDPAALPADESVEYEPLEKVRDEIRKTLATDKAVQELEQTMGEAAAQLQAEYNQYGSAVAEAAELKKASPKPPAKLSDLKWLADQYGLTYEKTAPLTIRELYETAVGKAADAATQRTAVTQAAAQSLELYEPMLSQDLEGDWYLVMKIEDAPRRVPEFKEVREQVVQAWKRAEAAKLAEANAKELAAEVQKSGAPFDQFFFAERGFEVIKPTAFFSWRSYPAGGGGMGTPPGLGNVPELKNIGPDLMEAAFKLKDKEAVGLLNFDRSAAYVIRLDRRQYTVDELKKFFLEEEGVWPGQVGRDMLGVRRQMFDQAVEQEILKDRAGFEYNQEWLDERAKRLQERQS